MELPDNEKTFTFEEKGGTTLQDFKGDFTVKCILNMLDKRILEIEKSRLRLDVVNPTSELAAQTHILANLKVRITKSPDWWKKSNNGNDLLDEDILVILFDKVMNQEEAWREELKALSEGSDQGN